MDPSYNPARRSQEDEREDALPRYSSHNFTSRAPRQFYSYPFSAGCEHHSIRSTIRSVLKEAWLDFLSDWTLENFFKWLIYILLVQYVLYFLIEESCSAKVPSQLGSQENPMVVHLIFKTVASASASAVQEAIVDASEQDITLAALKLVNGTLILSPAHQVAQ
ncbi:unnamed protein product [Sympodiomycopsis kandeliae]